MKRSFRWRVLAMVLVWAGCDEAATDVDASAPTDGRTEPRDANLRLDSGPPDGGPPPELCDPGYVPAPFPEPNAWPANRGPGGPRNTFAADALHRNCAYLDGGDRDTTDHHNLVTMYDGYLLMPWAPEYGRGGLTFWDVSDACAPRVVGSGYSLTMRETHAIGFSHYRGRWAVVDQLGAAGVPNRGGVQFWDLSDTTAPRAVADLELPGFFYPDAYARVTLSVFWQVPYVYAAGSDNGVFIIDGSDPRAPRHLGTFRPEPILRVGQVQVIGNLLIATAAEGPRTLLVDVSDPVDPQPIGGGDFLAREGPAPDARPREAYFTNFYGGYVYYARKDSGGGIIVYDLRNPAQPVFAGSFRSNGNGGYVFVKEDVAFTGESEFATMYDVSDLTRIREVGARMDLEGDLDTATPIGNVVVLSVDDGARTDQGSAIAPYATTPDATPPRVLWSWPTDGMTGLRTTSRIGLAISEMVDPSSAFEGSVRLYRSGADPVAGRVPTTVSAQETIVNVHPLCALAPDTEYTVEVMANGLVDFNGNALAETHRFTFRTGVE